MVPTGLRTRVFLVPKAQFIGSLFLIREKYPIAYSEFHHSTTLQTFNMGNFERN